MAFEKFTVTATPKPGAGTGAKATLTKRAGAKVSPATLTITLTVALAQDLSWSKGDKLEVLLGSDADHGLLRLRKNNSVGTAEVAEKRAGRGVPYVSISLGHVSAFVDRREAARHINFEPVLDGEEKRTGWVEFVMPKWADETGKRAKPGVEGAPSRLAASGPLGHKTRDVAPALMGDPPPGRRQQLAEMKEAG